MPKNTTPNTPQPFLRVGVFALQLVITILISTGLIYVLLTRVGIKSSSRIMPPEGQVTQEQLLSSDGAARLQAQLTRQNTDIVFNPDTTMPIKSFSIPVAIWEKYPLHTLTETNTTDTAYSAKNWSLSMLQPYDEQPYGIQMNIIAVPLDTSATVNTAPICQFRDASFNALNKYLREQYPIDQNGSLCDGIASSTYPMTSVYHDAGSNTYHAYTYIAHKPPNGLDGLTTPDIATAVGMPYYGKYGFVVEWHIKRSADQKKNAETLKDLQTLAELFLQNASHSICQNDYAGCY